MSMGIVGKPLNHSRPSPSVSAPKLYSSAGFTDGPMKTSDPTSPLQFSPTGMRLAMALAALPLVVPTGAWVWNLTAPESLWQLTAQLRPFTLSVTSMVAMPQFYDLDFPVHDLVYALLLAGWAIVIPLYAIQLFRFRRHIPAWARSKKGREAERMQTAKPWTLPMMYLLTLVILADILLFGQIFSFACLGIGYGDLGFGRSMFHLGLALFIFYLFSLGILQRMFFRLYRNTPIKQVGIGH